MTVHTLTEEWILAYAAGGLNEGQLLVAACHLSFHPELVDAVHEAEAVGGALLSDLPDAEVSPDMLATVLDRLDRPGAAERPVEAARIKGMPDPLTAYIGGGYDRLHWRVLGPGLRHALLWTGPDGQKAWLLRGEGARVIPEHGHSGDEWTLVLKGAYHARGERFVAGDLEMADPSVHHIPSLDPSEECICLAYTAGRIRPRSPIVRLMQPFIGL
ncbi:MAG TPA: ChrR family anti-sigma-E factor [Alphaproteobacteria bacterium]|nr:ChrR family anti-sigma-E factor [Alphaproteobacteria bacterium]